MKQITARVSYLLTDNGYTANNQAIITTYDKNDLAMTRCFQSYNSIVCVYDYRDKTVTFGRDWDYSNTTMKYLNKFLRSHIPFGRILGAVVNAAAIRKAIACGAAAYDPELV